MMIATTRAVVYKEHCREKDYFLQGKISDQNSFLQAGHWWLMSVILAIKN
jgi:hypothetical protein